MWLLRVCPLSEYLQTIYVGAPSHVGGTLECDLPRRWNVMYLPCRLPRSHPNSFTGHSMEDARAMSPEGPPPQQQQRLGLQAVLHQTLPRIRGEACSSARNGGGVGGGPASAPASPGGRHRLTAASPPLQPYPGAAYSLLPAHSVSPHRLSRPSPLHHASYTVTEHWGVLDLPGFDASLGRSTQHMDATTASTSSFSAAVSESSLPMHPPGSQDSLLWLTSATSLGTDSRGMSRSNSGETASLGHHAEYPGYFSVQGQAHHMPTIYSPVGGSRVFAEDVRGALASASSSPSQQSSTAPTPGGLLSAVARAFSAPRHRCVWHHSGPGSQNICIPVCMLWYRYCHKLPSQG